MGTPVDKALIDQVLEVGITSPTGDNYMSLFFGNIEGDKADAYQIEDIMPNSGYQMPVIGLGTWTLSNYEAENSVYHALKSGMRLIDTARYYRCEDLYCRG